MASVNKSDLINKVSNEFNLNKLLARKIVDYLFDVIVENLKKGNDILIKDIGTFKVVEKKNIKGRNIKTGESIVIPKRRYVTFKPSRKLKSEINS